MLRLHMVAVLAISCVWLLFVVACNEDDPVRPEEGTIIIDPGLETMWLLEGPDGFASGGVGDGVISGVPIGDYTVTWGETAGYFTPPDETKTLHINEELLFEATYVQSGTICIIHIPVYLPAYAYMDGPNGFHADYPDSIVQLSQMYPGDYTVSWEQSPGWVAPASATQTLVEGGSITFIGIYTAGTSPPK